MDTPLDNPVWHALIGPHRDLAIGRGAARQYPRDVAPFAGLKDGSVKAYVDLARDLPPGLEARLFRPADEPLPLGWEALDTFPMLQMIATRAPEQQGSAGAQKRTIAVLSPADRNAMRELVAIAKPGPFGPRTSELGRYLGVWEDGRLIAMAGERLRVQGHVELSGIATHPAARGRGFAAMLTEHLMRLAFAQGELPFLHVRVGNPAIALYRRLGFEMRRQIWVLWRKPLGDNP